LKSQTSRERKISDEFEMKMIPGERADALSMEADQEWLKKEGKQGEGKDGFVDQGGT